MIFHHRLDHAVDVLCALFPILICDERALHLQRFDCREPLRVAAGFEPVDPDFPQLIAGAEAFAKLIPIAGHFRFGATPEFG